MSIHEFLKLLRGICASLLPWSLWQLLIILASSLTLFLLSSFVLRFLFCLVRGLPTTLDLKVVHVAHVPRDPSSLLGATNKDRAFSSS